MIEANKYILNMSFLNRVIFLIGLFFSLCQHSYAQKQYNIDSLETIYHKGERSTKDYLEVLRLLSYNHPNLDQQLFYADELIFKAKALDSMKKLWEGYSAKGYAHGLKGNRPEALENHFKAADIAEKDLPDKKYTAYSRIAIGDVYASMNDSKNAIDYYTKVFPILQKENDTIQLAAAYYNLSDLYLKLEMPDSALVYLEKSGSIWKNANYEYNLAYNTGNIGRVYALQGKDELAEKKLDEAITVLEKNDDYYAIAEFLNNIGRINLKQNKLTPALKHTERSLQLAKNNGLKEGISTSSLQLSEIYERMGMPGKALMYYKDYNVYNDSVKNLATVQEMANIRTEYEVAQKQVEVDLLEKEAQILELKEKKQKNMLYGAGALSFLIFLLAMGLLRRFMYVKKTNKIIEKEKSRSENLLLNILPSETAEELKREGKVKAKKFESATILFTDFQSFTQFAENLDPEILVETVDYYYSQFDLIIEKYGLEKIKTIGDSYMCAGGLHGSKQDHAKRMILAAFEIVDFVEREKKNAKENDIRFNVRIGINTGPVVAGVVGTKKFAYDIWGDAVNIAARMEAHSESGKINVSENTCVLINDVFDCEFRGKVDVKNKGMMNMYFVIGKKTIHHKETTKAELSEPNII